MEWSGHEDTISTEHTRKWTKEGAQPFCDFSSQLPSTLEARLPWNFTLCNLQTRKNKIWKYKASPAPDGAAFFTSANKNKDKYSRWLREWWIICFSSCWRQEDVFFSKRVIIFIWNVVSSCKKWVREINDLAKYAIFFFYCTTLQ